MSAATGPTIPRLVRICCKSVPLLQPGGVLYSQVGHLPLVIEVFDDDRFWENEVGCKKPRMIGLGKSKLIVIKEGSPSGGIIQPPGVSRAEASA